MVTDVLSIQSPRSRLHVVLSSFRVWLVYVDDGGRLPPFPDLAHALVEAEALAQKLAPSTLVVHGASGSERQYDLASVAN